MSLVEHVAGAFFGLACKPPKRPCSPSMKTRANAPANSPAVLNMLNTTALVALSVGLCLGCAPDENEGTPSMGTATTDASPTTGGTETEPAQSTTGTQGTDETSGESTTSGGADGSSSDGGESGSTTGAVIEDGVPYDPGAPSCDGLETECAGESCCTTVNLPGGVVQVGRGLQGSDSCPRELITECFSDEQPEHDVAVDAFALDHYVVTVGRFRGFVDAWNDNWRPEQDEGAIAGADGSGWQMGWNDYVPPTFDLDCNDFTSSTWTDEPGANEDKPIDCVSWYHAQAFCIWDGGRLPTEAEWEYAAAGADQDRIHPWGSAPVDDTRSVYDADTLQPVGTKPDGAARWGHLDMAGNTFEWAYDCYNDDFFETPEASVDNAVLAPGTEGEWPCGPNVDGNDPHVFKGGGQTTDLVSFSRVATRWVGAASTPYVGTTFRCARGI